MYKYQKPVRIWGEYLLERKSRNINSLIFQEFDEKMRFELFELKQKKFIQYIDSFYYSVYLDSDFTMDTQDGRVRNFRLFVERQFALLCRKGFDDMMLDIPGVPKYFNVKHCYYAQSFDFMLDRPDHYRIMLTRYTANPVTPQILVQLASSGLWIDGVRKSIEDSLQDVYRIAEYFRFQVIQVQENRIDYCWHSNYLQNPEFFLRSDNFARMRVSRLNDSFSHETYYGKEEYEIDYKTLGKKSSNNIFFRMYHKSKEVVQMGYKAFFLDEWLRKGLINRYDFYCLSKAYENHSWSSLDKCRLEFYMDYGSNENIKEQCRLILEDKIKMKYDELHCFADLLTPPVTIIMNVEFQTMRKFSSSLVLPESDYNKKRYGPASRIFTILDEWKAITNYLTMHAVRLVKMEGDENKSRREDCPFWQALRQTKFIDFKYDRKQAVALRQYNHERNAAIVQKRALSSIVTYNLYAKGEKADSPDIQILDFINSLNDNDFQAMKLNQMKKIRRADYSNPIGLKENKTYSLVNNETGEIYCPDYNRNEDKKQ